MNIRMKNLILIAAMITAMITAASAQGIHTPDKTSPERKAILDTLRVPVEKDLRQKIVFVVETMNVAGNWAFASGSLQSTEGGEPNFRGTQYWEAKRAGMFDNNYFALLKKTAGKWRVVHHAIGCTDVCYVTWWHDYRAPKAIFPYTE